jgi:hypothetical protein
MELQDPYINALQFFDLFQHQINLQTSSLQAIQSLNQITGSQ